jgi:hypothetical protein
MKLHEEFKLYEKLWEDTDASDNSVANEDSDEETAADSRFISSKDIASSNEIRNFELEREIDTLRGMFPDWEITATYKGNATSNPKIDDVINRIINELSQKFPKYKFTMVGSNKDNVAAVVEVASADPKSVLFYSKNDYEANYRFEKTYDLRKIYNVFLYDKDLKALGLRPFDFCNPDEKPVVFNTRKRVDGKYALRTLSMCSIELRYTLR